MSPLKIGSRYVLRTLRIQTRKAVHLTVVCSVTVKKDNWTSVVRTTEVCVCVCVCVCMYVCCVGWLFSGGARLGRGLSCPRQFVTSFSPTHQANAWIVSQFIHNHRRSNAAPSQLHVRTSTVKRYWKRCQTNHKPPTRLCFELRSRNI